MEARAGTRERSAAVGLSILTHLALLAGLLWGMRSPPAPPEIVVELELAPDTRSPTPRRPLRRPPSPIATQPAPGQPTARPAVPAPPDVVPSPITSAPATTVAPSPPPNAALGAALRRTLGCASADLHRLSDAERRDCDLRLAGAAGRGGPLAGVDPGKLAGYAADKQREPFLARKPKNNCVPRVQETDMPGGPGAAPDKDWRTGVACAFSF
jgi:hypothetical protein